jgi:hypothetical protein
MSYFRRHAAKQVSETTHRVVEAYRSHSSEHGVAIRVNEAISFNTVGTAVPKVGNESHQRDKMRPKVYGLVGSLKETSKTLKNR